MEKHQWTATEDAKLIECLLDLTNAGTWQSNNGTFKAGFLKQLEKWMEEKLPGCGLQAQPHIESRVKLWKKQYHAISEMLGSNSSGFSWNVKDMCIEAEKRTFDEWVKSHPSAKGLRRRPFPYYEDWAFVFGKDRASSCGAKGVAVADIVEEVDKEPPNVWNEKEMYISKPSPGVEDLDGTASVSQTPYSPPSGAVQSKRGSKRKDRSGDFLVETLSQTMKDLGVLYRNFSENISKLASCFQHEVESNDRRSWIFDEIMKIDDLTDAERVRAGRFLANNSGQTHFFFTLPDPFRKEFVMQLLNEHSNG